MLAGLDETDADFAEQVRKAIFTFGHISTRVAARDIPKIVRMVDEGSLIAAFTAAASSPSLAPVAEFFFANMSQRMAQSLREEVATRGKVKDKEAEEAMTVIVNAIRQLEGAGELILMRDEE